MNPSIHWSTTLRILTQLRRDRRTVVMILLVPAVLTLLLHYVLSRQPTAADGRTAFDRLGIIQLGVLPCAVMFPITAITMRRERSNGTLDRLFATPMTKLDLLAGYGTAFSIAAAAQAGLVALIAFRVTHLRIEGSPMLVLMISVLGAILGVTLGLFFSAFAATEFQAVQFGPLILVPQLFLAGVLVPRETMPGALQGVSNVLPLSYAVDALQEVSAHSGTTLQMWHDVAIMVVFIVAAVLGGAATLQRQTR